MNILLVCKYLPTFKERISPFNECLVSSLRAQGAMVDIFRIKKTGFFGYLFHILELNIFLHKHRQYDLIHAVYGLSGLVGRFQLFKPFIVSMIGTDINNKYQRSLAKIFIINKKYPTVFVSQQLFKLAGEPSNGKIITYGIDLEKFFPLDQVRCKTILNLDLSRKYVLFGASYKRKEKNSKLAFEAIAQLKESRIELIELVDISEENINILINAVDSVLLTSLHEGSPTIIKEAMACNCPVVSTDVGDVRSITEGLDGCYITSFNPGEIAEKINYASIFRITIGETKGRNRIIELGLDSVTIAKRMMEVYQEVINYNQY